MDDPKREALLDEIERVMLATEALGMPFAAKILEMAFVEVMHGERQPPTNVVALRKLGMPLALQSDDEDLPRKEAGDVLPFARPSVQ